MNRSIKVKKICSLNPTKYKEITLERASDLYMDYVANFYASEKDYEIIKSFALWLESEI